ncbi:hypothetical protein Tco_0110508 [Tanacetum coccineum]
MKYDEKTGVYSCQVDERWFNLSADILRKALDITPVDPTHPFELPPTGDTVIDFVNQLGYPEPVEFVSNIRVNYVYQPWRAILTLITLINQLLWEEFTQGIQTFFSHKASHKASLKDPKKKAVHLLIPYGRFTKMIIYYLGSTSDVHKRSESHCHLLGDDFLLGNLKFISKGETNEVFGMAIPKQLITQAIQQSSYYPKYLEMVAKNTKKTPQDSASKQPEPATKRAPPKKPTTTTPVKPTKPPSSKQPKSPTKKPSKRKLPQKVRKGKPSFQLVDEDDEAPQESVPQGEGDDPDLELAKKMSLDAHQEKGEGEGADADIERAIKLSLDPSFLPQGQAPVGGVAIRDPVSETTPKLPEVVGKGKAIVTEEQVAHSLIDLSKKKRTTDQFILVRRDQAPHDSTTGPSSQPEDDTSEKVVHESSSTTDSERTESGTEAAAPKGDKEQGEVASSTVTSGVGISVRTEDQAGSDPGKAHEALAGPDPEPMQEDQTGSDSGKVHVSLAGPNPEHNDRIPSLISHILNRRSQSHSTNQKRKLPSVSPTTLPEITFIIALQAKSGKNGARYDFIEKFLVAAGVESIKNQESKKDPKEITSESNREQGGRTPSCQRYPSGLQIESAQLSIYTMLYMEAYNLQMNKTGIRRLKAGFKDHKESMIVMIDEDRYEGISQSGGHCDNVSSSQEELVRLYRLKVNAIMTYRATYGITTGVQKKGILHQQNHSEPQIREAVRIQMQIFSVQTLNPSVLIAQESILHTAVNMMDRKPGLRNQDYTIVPKPRAVIYRDRNDQRKLMRLNEIHKFSDGTLTRVMEKLDHMVKDFHLFEYNKGMETRKCVVADGAGERLVLRGEIELRSRLDLSRGGSVAANETAVHGTGAWEWELWEVELETSKTACTCLELYLASGGGRARRLAGGAGGAYVEFRLGGMGGRDRMESGKIALIGLNGSLVDELGLNSFMIRLARSSFVGGGAEPRDKLKMEMGMENPSTKIVSE